MIILLWILVVVIFSLQFNAIMRLIKERNTLESQLEKSVKNHDKYVTDEKVRISYAQKPLEEKIDILEQVILNRDSRLGAQKDAFRKKLKAKDQVIHRRNKRIENLLAKINTQGAKKK